MYQMLFFYSNFLRFHIALAILEPQIYVVVEQFGAESISLLSGRLVLYFDKPHFSTSNNPVTIYLKLSRKIFRQTTDRTLNHPLFEDFTPEF